MSFVHCPKDKDIIPMENCCKCEYIRRDDDVSNIWCRYLIGNRKVAEECAAGEERAKQNDEVRSLYARIGYKRKRADLMYKTGKSRVAEEIEHEIMKLRKEIKQHEIENQKFNHKEKAAL
jgi:hypothetical protein